jgi:hypothetical protein
MFQTLKDMCQSDVFISRERIGKIGQLIIDDHNWVIRYISISLNNPARKKVLISPCSVESFDNSILNINCSIEQLINAPQSDFPISREQEIALHDHYRIPYYWDSPFYKNSLGKSIYQGISSAFSCHSPENTLIQKRQSPHSHLHWAEELCNSHLMGINEEAGKIEELIIEKDDWVIRYLLINSSFLLSGHLIPISPLWIKAADWDDAEVYVNFKAKVIISAPKLEQFSDLDRDLEKRIFAYFDCPPYWK